MQRRRGAIKELISDDNITDDSDRSTTQASSFAGILDSAIKRNSHGEPMGMNRGQMKRSSRTPLNDKSNVPVSKSTANVNKINATSKIRKVPDFARIFDKNRGEYLEEHQARIKIRSENLIAAGEKFKRLATPRAKAASTRATSEQASAKVTFKFNNTPKVNRLAPMNTYFAMDKTPVKQLSKLSITPKSSTPVRVTRSSKIAVASTATLKEDKLKSSKQNSKYKTTKRASLTGSKSKVGEQKSKAQDIKVHSNDMHATSTNRKVAKRSNNMKIVNGKNTTTKAPHHIGTKTNEKKRMPAMSTAHFMQSTVAVRSRVGGSTKENQKDMPNQKIDRKPFVRHRARALEPYVDTTVMSDHQFEEYMAGKRQQQGMHNLRQHKPTTSSTSVASYREQNKQHQQLKRKSRSDALRNQHRNL